MSDLIKSLGINTSVLLAQFLNLLILFFAFKYLVWDRLQKSIDERRSLMKKLENADMEYNQIISRAEMKSKEIFAQWEKEKNRLISEWKQLADKKYDETMKKTEQEAKILIENAKIKSEKMFLDINQNFEDSVKKVSSFVIKKLIWEDRQISEQYIKNTIKELK